MTLLPPELDSISRAAQDAVVALAALSGDGESGTSTREYDGESDRLALWIGENDVRSGKLDHKLREASHLRDRVLSLLTRLSTIASPSPATGESRQSARVDVLPTATPDIDVHPDVPLLDAKETIDTNSLSLDTDVTLEDSIDYSLWNQVHDIVTLLLNLGPALQNPAPLDRLERQRADSHASPDDLRNDISHVRTAFPNAERDILYRLGRANWDRRQYLATIRRTLASKPGVPLQHESTNEGITSAESDYSAGESDDAFQSPSLHFLGRVSNISQGTSEGQTPGATSVPSEFGFSVIGSELTTPTEVSKDVYPSNERIVHVRKRYNLPLPPHPNEHLDGEDFTCVYCAHTITSMNSKHEWRKHVYEDLQPYVCTYTDCLLSAKTYGRRSDWWSHEEERHRTRRSWMCPPCEQAGIASRFDTSASFEAHIRDRHPYKVAPSQIPSISEMCLRKSEIEPAINKCPLCQREILPSGSRFSPKFRDNLIKKHVASHMEQVALFVSLPEGQIRFEGEGIESQQDDSDAADDTRSETYDIASLASHGVHDSIQQMKSAVVKDFIDNQQLPSPGPEAGREGSLGKDSDVSFSGNAQRSNQRIAVSKTAIDFPLFVGMPPRNEHFYCRQSLLADMNKILRVPGTICYTHGAGGVGKTLAAIEYVYQHQWDFDAVFWLQADTGPGLVDSYFQMATALGIVENPADHDRFVGRARDWLERPDTRWLLVFDNVVRWVHVARYMPNNIPETKGSVLILTQNSKLPLTGTNVVSLRIEPLNRNDGAEMLLQYLDRDPLLDKERTLAREISALCGGFPVAIAQASGYVSYQQCTLEELFDTFREWRMRTGMATDEADDLPPAFREASFKYEDMLEMVWAVTLRELTQDARDVLNILAYLNSASVPQKMLWKVHEDPRLHCIDSREKRRMQRIHNSLTQRRLILEADENYAMHRSLSRGIRADLAKDLFKQQLVFDQAIALVRETFPHADEHQQPRPDKWSEYQKLQPHLHALHLIYRGSKPRIKGSTEFVQLLMDAGLDQSERMFHNEGLTMLHTAEIALDDCLDSQTEDTQAMKAGIHALIALMYDDAGIGKRQEALDRRREALRLRQNMFQASKTRSRTDEVLLFNSEMDYVVSLFSYYRYEEAEPIMEKCLAKYREWGSEEEIPFEYAKYYHNMGFIRMHQRNFEEAIYMAEKGILLMEQRGLEISTSRFRFDLAGIIIQSGDLERALHELQEIYDQWMRSLGPTNQLCLYSMYAIGATYELMEDPPEAEKWFRKILQVRRSITSWPEEAYARAEFHLSKVLDAQGVVEEAKTWREKALGVLHRLLNPADRPPELVDVTDESILFDHLLPTGPRFTGRGLMERFVYKPL